jgi:hypothetical protein
LFYTPRSLYAGRTHHISSHAFTEIYFANHAYQHVSHRGVIYIHNNNKVLVVYPMRMSALLSSLSSILFYAASFLVAEADTWRLSVQIIWHMNMLDAAV